MLKVQQKYLVVNFRPSPLKNVAYLLDYTTQNWLFIPKSYVLDFSTSPTLLETSTRQVFHLPHFHSLIMLANLPTTVTHGDTRRRTPIQLFLSTMTTTTHTQVWTLSHAVSFLYAFLFFSTHMAFIGWP